MPHKTAHLSHSLTNQYDHFHSLRKMYFPFLFPNRQHPRWMVLPPPSQPELVATLTQPSAGSGLVLNQSLDHTGLSIQQQRKQDQGSRAKPYRWAIL